MCRCISVACMYKSPYAFAYVNAGSVYACFQNWMSWGLKMPAEKPLSLPASFPRRDLVALVSVDLPSPSPSPLRAGRCVAMWWALEHSSHIGLFLNPILRNLPCYCSPRFCSLGDRCGGALYWSKSTPLPHLVSLLLIHSFCAVLFEFTLLCPIPSLCIPHMQDHIRPNFVSYTILYLACIKRRKKIRFTDNILSLSNSQG